MTPKFEITHCSQCGGQFGPGNQGYSHCEDHRKPSAGALEGRALRMIMHAADLHLRFCGTRNTAVSNCSGLYEIAAMARRALHRVAKG